MAFFISKRKKIKLFGFCSSKETNLRNWSFTQRCLRLNLQSRIDSELNEKLNVITKPFSGNYVKKKVERQDAQVLIRSFIFYLNIGAFQIAFHNPFLRLPTNTTCIPQGKKTCFWYQYTVYFLLILFFFRLFFLVMFNIVIAIYSF